MKSDPASKSENPQTPFERFEELARKLFAVPKEELDKQPNGKHHPKRKKPKPKSS